MKPEMDLRLPATLPTPEAPGMALLNRVAKTSYKTRPVKLGPVTVGDDSFVVIAGPCSIESSEQLLACAGAARATGAAMLRGGVFKMRTDPKAFQGLGSEAIEMLKVHRQQIGLPIVTEVTDPRQIEMLDPLVDAFQVGTRNMYNYALLKELGQSRKAVLLKRGFSALIKEWLLAADYVRQEGNANVVLCERGIRTFETATRNTLDLSAIALVKNSSDLPVMADPSHGAGRADLVAQLSLAAAAVGADGLLLEIHPDPALARSDADQALNLSEFESLMRDLNVLLPVLGRKALLK